MTAPLQTTTPHDTVVLPASQNTAPVAEYRCLFTHDVRRKQKRWQDGYLRFHSFNHRVMVYDESRNFLGDTYYKDSSELQEGDQLNLDKGIMIEVAEAIGVTQTDLTPLFEKKLKEIPARPTTVASQTRPFQRPSVVASSIVQRNTSQLPHKSLNTLLGTPKGPLGKAQPMQSPFEARKAKDKENRVDAGPSAQRPKLPRPASPWRASSPTQEESPIAKRAVSCLPQSPAAQAVQKLPSLIPPVANVFHVESEPKLLPTVSPDMTVSNTSTMVAKTGAKLHFASKTVPASKTNHQSTMVPGRRSVQTPKISRGKTPVLLARTLETPRHPAPRSSPPVSVSNRLANVENSVQTLEVPLERPVPASSLPRNPKTKSLRLSAGVMRGTLICQTLPSLTSKMYSESRPPGTVQEIGRLSCSISRDSSPVVPDIGNSRCGKSKTKLSEVPPKLSSKRKKAQRPVGKPVKRTRIAPTPPEPTLAMFDDPELTHGMMDESLLALSPPMSLLTYNTEATPKPSKTKIITVGKLAGKQQDVQECVILDVPTKTSPLQNSRGRIFPQESPTADSKAALETTVPSRIIKTPDTLSLAVSPAHADTTSTRSRTSSTSPKNSALSTGAFSKKPKLGLNDMPAPHSFHHDKTVVLLPYPLHAAPKSSLMSTTELHTLLQTSKKPKKPGTDYIEETKISPKTCKSESRSFRRVRSENDAPIPSAVKDWEKRNLPLQRISSALTEVSELTMDTMVSTIGETVVDKGIRLPASKKKDPGRIIKRTQSLRVQSDGLSATTAQVDVLTPLIDQDVGPWSIEAGDLFDWKPPGR
ncbi:hypothetical protein IAQ61_007364 [Plenodomus lingam]|uniref:5'-3' DNA helicase ZGRF1-like N-terminal domain-containing protein n=1 Tax=Leptosphaeria maculans (strain JN3 / isolate v23.1.3 / race Av1-4-5-6-7-8) TaxID=985895 RepID=E5A0S4_LEPMJ|nr:hypothetical protein LEMA_P103510.1 [Plenodomus lingam JN3]KAH9868057.1 hypothetical protein IAQ61_007364 [Plenodomus lingam]CBX97220.1 hypothetical protein LEMA_P103510.1 [Plenodomus lingam JN3]